MDQREFDALAARLSSGTHRRGAVRGLVGGALAAAAVAGLADGAHGKEKGRKQAAAETNAVGNGKRIICYCPDDNPANCSTKRLKTKKAKKRLKRFPNSYRGRCDSVTTTTTTAAPTTTTLAPTTTPQPPGR